MPLFAIALLIAVTVVSERYATIFFDSSVAFALSAIDTPLPKPREDVELMLNYAAPWADVPTGRHHVHFGEYPDESIADWHRKRGLTVD